MAGSGVPALAFVFRGGELLLREPAHGPLVLTESLPTTAIEKMLPAPVGAWTDIGTWLGHRCLTTAVDRDTIAPPGHVFRRLRELLGPLGEAGAALAGRAFQLAEWARTHRYCGACATPTQRLPDEFCLRCPACGHAAYPRISPAMMVLIRQGPRVLLARNASFPGERYSALAGFVEAGEAVEDTVHREVMEEVGLRVHRLQYFKSQPWPFPHSLMLAFTADYLDGQIRVDGKEIVDARWFGPGDTLPDIPPPDTIAGSLIRANLAAQGSE